MGKQSYRCILVFSSGYCDPEYLSQKVCCCGMLGKSGELSLFCWYARGWRLWWFEIRVGSKEWDGEMSWWGGSTRSRRGWWRRVNVIFSFFLRIVGSGVSGVLVAVGGVIVACWVSWGSFRFFVGVRGVGDCDDYRGAGGDGVLLCEFDDGVEA